MTTWKATVACVALMLAAAGCEDGNGATSEQDRRVSRPGPAVSLPCQEKIESLDGAIVADDHTVVLGRVQLPTRAALGVSRTAEDPEFPLFAKDGLVLKARTAFQLIVPDSDRSRLRIGWGSPARPTTRLEVLRCQTTDPSKPWLAYAGGYFVSEPGCFSLTVKSGNRTRQVDIGVGAACPGQRPPPDPS